VQTCFHITITCQLALVELQHRVLPSVEGLKAALEALHRLSRGPTPLERLDWLTSISRCGNSMCAACVYNRSYSLFMADVVFGSGVELPAEVGLVHQSRQVRGHQAAMAAYASTAEAPVTKQ
jgi:hypothetical protein